MDKDLKQNLTATDTWVRGLYILLFLVVYSVVEALFLLIVVFQFLHTLLTRRTNEPLLDFSENLCAYLYEIWLYMSFNSNDLPFPFGDWPNEGAHYVLDEDDDDDEEDFAEPVVVVGAEATEVADEKAEEPVAKKPARKPAKKPAKKAVKPDEEKPASKDWPPKAGE